MQQEADANAEEIRLQSQGAFESLCLRCDGKELERLRRLLAQRDPLRLKPDGRQKRLKQPGRTIHLNCPLETGFDSKQLKQLARRIGRLMVDLEKLGQSRFIANEYPPLGLQPLLAELRYLSHVIERGVPRDDPATSRRLDGILEYVKERMGAYNYPLVCTWLRPDHIFHCQSEAALKRWHIRFRKVNS